MGSANGLDAGVIRFVVYALVSVLVSGAVSGCRGSRPGGELKRHGDEIMACGRLFHTGTPVVLWTDPGGYDAYRVERRFVAWTNANWEATRAEGASLDTPNRYGLRREGLSPETLEKVRGGDGIWRRFGGWWISLFCTTTLRGQAVAVLKSSMIGAV